MSPEVTTQLVDKTFHEQTQLRKKHLQKDGNSFVFDMSLEDFTKVYNAGTEMGCMDEGVPCGPDVAGAGILFGLEERPLPFDDAFELSLQRAVELFKPRVLSGELKTITSHSGCGAAKLFCDIHEYETDDPDAIGKKFAEELARRLTEETGIDVSYRHVDSEEMSRDASYHDATIVYLSAATFDPHIVGAAEGFVINPHYHPRDNDHAYTIAELRVAAKIAFGDHGFGSRLTADNPFIIVPIGNSKEGFDEEDLRAIAEKAFEGDSRPIVIAKGVNDAQDLLLEESA